MCGHVPKLAVSLDPGLGFGKADVLQDVAVKLAQKTPLTPEREGGK